MINTSKEINLYTDVFGNEITEYEQIERYTVRYNGNIFEGDKDGWNSFNTDRWEDAIALYHQYGNVIEISIKDNEYDVVFEDGEWN
jgi:hypothetical protein